MSFTKPEPQYSAPISDHVCSNGAVATPRVGANTGRAFASGKCKFPFPKRNLTRPIAEVSLIAICSIRARPFLLSRDCHGAEGPFLDLCEWSIFVQLCREPLTLSPWLDVYCALCRSDCCGRILPLISHVVFSPRKFWLTIFLGCNHFTLCPLVKLGTFLLLLRRPLPGRFWHNLILLRCYCAFFRVLYFSQTEGSWQPYTIYTILYIVQYVV